jgi:hypothetical protein
MKRPTHNSNRSVRWIDQFARDVDGLGAEIAKLHRAHRAKSPAAPRSGEMFTVSGDGSKILSRPPTRNFYECLAAHEYMALDAALPRWHDTVPASVKLYGESILESIAKVRILERWEAGHHYILCGTPRRWHRVTKEK